ncbi:hypothetical protein OG21DRAFT_1330421 [Imleria badia]|nr:hypothetical protein OG21DRAFT_1330421 [Imleria badia]
MAAELTHGRYRIISLTEGERPTSINLTKPGSQLVRLGGPVDVWTIKKESRTFTLSIGGYAYTRIIDDKVTVTIHPEENVEWIATRRELHNAYTWVISFFADCVSLNWSLLMFSIQPARDEILGWTVPVDSVINPVVIDSLLLTRQPSD